MRNLFAAGAGPWILAATIMASSMVFIDGTAVNVALPVLQRDLHATIVDTQWIVEVYALFLSALILVGGSLGDHFGRKRVFLIGVVAFAVSSALCGAAQNAAQLIAFRATQGMGSALLTPGSLSLLGAAFAGEQRGRAIGIWSSFTAVTSAMGPLLGGLIVEHASWRWIFLINVPLAWATVAVTASCVPESRDSERVHHVDWAGATLATLGLGAIVYALISAAGTGWLPSDVRIIGAGAALLVAFVITERQVPSPMMPLRLFAQGNFSAINLMTLLQYGALGGALFFLPFNLIQVQHYSPGASGAALLPFIGLVSILSPWAGRLSSAIGPKTPLAVGALMSSLGFAALALPTIGGSYWTTFFPGVIVLGLGMALVVSPLTTTVMASVDPDHFGVASGINNAVARVASLLAVAIFSLVVVAAFDRNLSLRLDQIQAPEPIKASVYAQRSSLAAIQMPESASPAEASEIEAAVAKSYVNGFRLAMLLGAALALASSLCALVLIRQPRAASARAPRSP